MTDFKEKPPTQVAGVAGFVAFTTPADEKKEPRINWVKLATLPPFQMFAQEKYGMTGELHTWVKERLDMNQSLYQEYANWHKAKGYWENETPMGEVI